MTFVATLKQRARQLKAEVHALYLAARHPETPWYAKLYLFAILAYALSPIDLIPDFLPGIGLLDDASFFLWVLTKIQGELTRFTDWEREDHGHEEPLPTLLPA